VPKEVKQILGKESYCEKLRRPRIRAFALLVTTSGNDIRIDCMVREFVSGEAPPTISSHKIVPLK
jgi:hypothetical protein